MNFTVYSKEGCPFCTKVVQVLQLSKLNHVVYELDQDMNYKKSYYLGDQDEISKKTAAVADQGKNKTT